MQKEIDVIEDDILKKYPLILEILLYDQTTKKNILWATDNYNYLGNNYNFSSQIKIESITGINSQVIMPRVLKSKLIQKTRSKEMAEVYTPSWVCNEQINSIDNSWFNKENVFNKKIVSNNGKITWETNRTKILFPKDKTWKDYINNIRLEVSCGEAPYLTSRYDTTTGEYISVDDRIGFLDRKIRVVNENIKTKNSWLKYVELAYKSIYGYEYHGDSLLLAREALLYTFIDNYFKKFNVEPKLEEVQKIANIISWNIWQMDGLTAGIPNNENLDIKYCLIMDWTKNNSLNNIQGTQIKFIDLIRQEGGK
ncbi:restriction endonuclease subunit M [Arcobacter cryaerophilus gv. occultus]|uniref:restriction endonuclease subunit M n=1 Tax=Aliarcobacter cryaerophilus TaxID=28198 RepID=UPI000D012FA4|nr:restriction endonuclease subunit M [Aliarcobacter cryaerophilus]PRM91239.1 restriction endonuclease subunit M [Arcobacter cryaerophilus gv. occultus]